MLIEMKVMESGDEATIIAWHKKTGEPVAPGEKLVDIETAKTTLEIEATHQGILNKITKQVGDTITREDVIAIIETS